MSEYILFNRRQTDYGFCSQWFISPFSAPLSHVYTTLGQPYPPADGRHLEISSNTAPHSSTQNQNSQDSEDQDADGQENTPHDPTLIFSCTEQWMMLSKALLFSDIPIATRILATTDPAAHKRLGRAVSPFSPSTWDMHKCTIVRDGNLLKFSQNAGLKRRLLATAGKKLVEASPSDRVWGIGFAANKALSHQAEWGQNLLGKALDEVRDRLAEE